MSLILDDFTSDQSIQGTWIPFSQVRRISTALVTSARTLKAPSGSMYTDFGKHAAHVVWQLICTKTPAQIVKKVFTHALFIICPSLYTTEPLGKTTYVCGHDVIKSLFRNADQAVGTGFISSFA